MGSNGCGSNTGKVERSKANNKGRSVSVRRKGEGERDEGRKMKRKRQSTSRDLINKKARSLRTKHSRGKNTLHERESQRKKMFTKICFFFQEGTCTKGDFCTFSHDVTNEREQVERRLDATEGREDHGVEVLYLRDKTTTVKTLDIKEHFSKFGDVVKVMFIGKQGGGNLFKVVVNNGAWKPRRKKVSHYTTICGVQMEVESKGQNSTMSRRDSSSSWPDRSPSRQSHTIGETSSRSGEERGEYSGNWSGRLEKRRTRIDARALGIWRERRADQEWQASVVMEHSSMGKDCDLAPVMPTILSESSVDSFLKGVRSEVEMFKVEENKNGVTGNNEALLNEDKQVMPDEIKNEVVGLRLVKVGWKVKKEVVVKEPAEFHKDVLMLLTEAETVTDLNNVKVELPLEEVTVEGNANDESDRGRGGRT